MSSIENIVKADHISVTFPTGPAISDISFTIERGDFLAVIGPNGSGKTVLVRTLLGALPYTGTIEWKPGARMGYVPQQIDIDRYVSLTLGDFLNLKIKILKLATDAVTKAITLVGLPETALKSQIRFLSGGQLQRGLVAFALLGDPDVIFLDEPTASIDVAGEEQIYETLHRLQDATGMTIVLISHELDLVSRYATKILCINRQMICFGDPTLSLKTEVLEKLYGTPAHVHKL
ncbi:MAG: metal ABC transporter ATP-binding protein [bacterium]|nr:metal ABC transporter ATP-binding protein [bacterium]